MKSHRELDAWQRGIALVIECYEITKRLPPEERFGLSAQLRRAAISIPANLAEGHDRRGPNEFAHFVSIARGSAAEVETLLIVIGKLGYVERTEIRRVLVEQRRVGQLLTRLHQSLGGSHRVPSPEARAPRGRIK